MALFRYYAFGLLIGMVGRSVAKGTKSPSGAYLIGLIAGAILAWMATAAAMTRSF